MVSSRVESQWDLWLCQVTPCKWVKFTAAGRWMAWNPSRNGRNLGVIGLIDGRPCFVLMVVSCSFCSRCPASLGWLSKHGIIQAIWLWIRILIPSWCHPWIEFQYHPALNQRFSVILHFGVRDDVSTIWHDICLRLFKRPDGVIHCPAITWLAYKAFWSGCALLIAGNGSPNLFTMQQL